MKNKINESNFASWLRGAGGLMFAALYFFTALSVEAVCTTVRAPLDFDGDNKTDQVIVRNMGGGAGGQLIWYIGNSSGTPITTAAMFGVQGDTIVPADYDGDGKTDLAVWRSNSSLSAFYILQSQTNSLRSFQFGIPGDNPRVTADYTGDGKADPAVYRNGATFNDPSFWYYLASSGASAGNVVGVQWGTGGTGSDDPAPGDYDGDGRADFVVRRGVGEFQSAFYLNQTTDGIKYVYVGYGTDQVVPGDYDGDCKTDIAVLRTYASNPVWSWFWISSLPGNGVVRQVNFGTSATDIPTQGDYDGDGDTDISVWRQSATAGTSSFYWRGVANNSPTFSRQWGQQGDYPVANFNAFQ